MVFSIKSKLSRLKNRFFSTENVDSKVVVLFPTKKSIGHVLVSYVLEPFLLAKNNTIPNSHTHYWESMQIVQTFLDLGYSVDVISYRNMVFNPIKNYQFFISARTNFETIAKRLPNSCIKVAHLDTSHWITNNHNAYVRLLDLKNRRKVSIQNMKMIEINRAIEFADLATILGNEFTINSYAYSDKPIYRIPISAPSIYPWDETKDFDQCRNNYLWFGSGGFVHKGLDLVIEVFKDMPDYHLTIFGPVEQEKEFVKAYHSELYETPNIHTVGWIDIDSPEFLEHARNTAALIYPTCAEGGGGSAITCMHAGIIPILSYEASVDLPNCGYTLKNCSIEEIKNTIQHISSLSKNELQTIAKRAWKYARENHTKENFSKEFENFVKNVLITWQKNN